MSSQKTMKEAHIQPDTSVTLHTVPIPQITQPSQLLIRVSVSGSNPKDWKMATGTLMTISNCPNSGDDISGTVIAVGTSVLDFKPGDRVAALHELGTPYGSYAEYAIVNNWATFHLPEEMTFEEAATVPMATYMAAIGLFGMLRVTPGPWYAPSGGTPLVIYGASSAVGAAVVKLAGISGVHPLICVAGAGQAFVETLIDRSKGDTIFDYREGPESVVRSIKEVLGGRDLEYVFDAISENGSHHYFCGALGQKRGKVTFVLGGYREDIPGGIEQSTTMAGCLWKSLKGADPRSRLGMETGGTDFAFAYSRLIGVWLQDGRLKIHPFEVVDGGLAGVETALKRLREGEPSAKKFVVRINDD